MSTRLDFTNPAEVTAWLEGLRVSFDDLDGAVEDMLLPPRERELGPVFHRKYVTEARGQIRQALAYAAPDPEHGDPSGSGSSPAL